MQVSNSLSNGHTLTTAVFANQQTIPIQTSEENGTEIMYYSDTGLTTSSANLTYNGTTVDVNGDVYVSNAVIGEEIKGVQDLTTDQGFTFVTNMESASVCLDINNNRGYESREYDFRMSFGVSNPAEDEVSPLHLYGEETTFNMPLRISPPGAPLTPGFYLDYGTISLPTVASDVYNCTKYTFPPLNPFEPDLDAFQCQLTIFFNTVFRDYRPAIIVTFEDTTSGPLDDQTNLASYVIVPNGSPNPNIFDRFFLTIYGINDPDFPGSNISVNWMAIGGASDVYYNPTG